MAKDGNGNIHVGEPKAKNTDPSHVPGVRQGNRLGALRKERGLVETADGVRATAERSTGINPNAREPITPGAPKLSPA